MNSNYKTFAIIILCSAVVMYAISYTMIDSFAHFYLSINKGYMVLMMVAGMGIVMLVGMRTMYKNKKLNRILYAAFAVLLLVSFLFARSQTIVGNEKFLKSMIPHHSMAILICQEASITDPEIEDLCDEIIRSQKQEIDQMKKIMERY